jgi:two-component system sensor histidine kinase RegB
MNNSISQNTNRKNFAQLLLLRTIAIFVQTITILFVNFVLEISLPLNQMFSVIAGLAILNFISFYRYKSQKNISAKALFFELFFDVSAFALQIYFSGGASNPFISLFLLQVIIAAILLQGNYAWLIATITTIYYILLSLYRQHLHAFHDHGEMSGFFDLHLQGMLMSYIISAVLLLIFLGKIMQNLRERDEKIHAMKKDALEKNQMIRTALLASAAAHELGTPLATISVILGDWKKMNLEKDLISDITTIENQVERCKKIISEILAESGKTRVEEASKNS